MPEQGAITRRDGRRVNTVQGFIVAGLLPAKVLSDYRTALSVSGFELPAGYRIEFGGEEAERNRAISYLTGSVLLLMVLMVTVLVVSFGSFRLMAVILSIGFLSVGLGLLSLYVFGHNLDPYATVGVEPFTPAVLGTQQIAGITTSSYPQAGTWLICVFALAVVFLTLWHVVRGLRVPSAAP